MVAHSPHVHAAAAYTGTAVVTAVFINLHADDIEPVEETVDRAKRTDKAAEAAIAEYAKQPDDKHNDELTREEDSQHGELFRVHRV